MRVCGIDYSGSDLIPVVLDDSEGECSWLELETKKITLNDIWDTDDVRLFLKTVTAFLAENRVDRVVIKKRPTGGKFGGGAASFRMGALVQVSTEKPVDFLPSQTVAATLRKSPPAYPDGLNKYQRTAYELAVALVRRGNGL